jgi:hypothetical protein
MNKEQYNELIEQVTASQGENLLLLLDEVKNHIADARNGDFSTEARKCAIASIDEKLYNIIKQGLNVKPKKKEEPYFNNMI